mmetsp:Transcript_16793/g.24950  ORF Transcript_16793/g.24950 Transcript_16793/m.24950 type:complete len:99 (-) Transcript_16793:33-329(-)
MQGRDVYPEIVHHFIFYNESRYNIRSRKIGEGYAQRKFGRKHIQQLLSKILRKIYQQYSGDRRTANGVSVIIINCCDYVPDSDYDDSSKIGDDIDVCF